MAPAKFSIAFTTDRHWSLSWATRIQSTWNSPASFIQSPFQYFLHSSPGLPTGPFRLETTISAHISLPPHPCYMPCPAPSTILQNPNNPLDSANHNSSHYTVLPNLPPIPPSLVQYSQAPWASVLPLPWQTRLHTHTKQQAQLYCCTLQ